jgi:glycosyltransferase involved in cell wall biosynthesis
MNILELNFEKTWRGGERQTLYNMMGFRNAGHQVSLLCSKRGPLEARAKEEGFKTYAFSNVFSAFFFLMFRSRKYDILHAQSSHILTYAVLAKRFHGNKIIFTRRIFKTPRGRFTKWKYDLTDRIVAISPAIKKVFEGFLNKDVTVISDIVEEKELNRGRAERLISGLGLGHKKFIIGTTAALTREKGPFVMIEAIHALSGKRKDFVFLHFGSGILEREMKERIKKYELESIYHLMGFVENAEDIFSVLDLFVMSSEMEGLGSSVLDAFVYKVPVVSTDAGGLAELVKDGRGVLCKKNSPELLASGIEEVFIKPELVSKMTSLAFDYVKQFHSIQYITNQYIDLIHGLQNRQ